jgi:uncharacterized protein (TIGR00369 family)
MRISQAENPFLHMLGLDLIRWDSSGVEFELELQPWHLNRQSKLQGGVIATLLDVACGYAGLFTQPGEAARHGATLSLSTNFLASISKGTVRATGRHTGGGRNLYFSEAQVVSTSGMLLATAQGTFKYQKVQP